ncbi:hypothetical protein L1987_86851 [Smallanthus sonchifolius]|uniref:Uncharacterized protein n=1 Tax=Smallanthus sonchifolius TaxID=185202 RepID=A0ACB8Y0K4_9ASTR|nr:hypothetical protein L1987_86851 [Smallanthus sonchifolius]
MIYLSNFDLDITKKQQVVNKPGDGWSCGQWACGVATVQQTAERRAAVATSLGGGEPAVRPSGDSGRQAVEKVGAGRTSKASFDSDV